MELFAVGKKKGKEAWNLQALSQEQERLLQIFHQVEFLFRSPNQSFAHQRNLFPCYATMIVASLKRIHQAMNHKGEALAVEEITEEMNVLGETMEVMT